MIPLLISPSAGILIQNTSLNVRKSSEILAIVQRPARGRRNHILKITNLSHFADAGDNVGQSTL
jgi:hypothetical protein